MTHRLYKITGLLTFDVVQIMGARQLLIMEISFSNKAIFLQTQLKAVLLMLLAYTITSFSWIGTYFFSIIIISSVFLGGIFDIIDLAKTSSDRYNPKWGEKISSSILILFGTVLLLKFIILINPNFAAYGSQEFEIILAFYLSFICQFIVQFFLTAWISSLN